MVVTNKNFIEQPVPSTAKETRVLMKGISWETYKKLMSEVGDDRAWRIAYDRGVFRN